jgi:alpha-mannosidase
MTPDKPTVHLVGNAHIDPVWLWRWQEGFAEIKATFRAALDRLDEYPDFIFTAACASYYRWVEQNAPDIFADIKRRVAEGRWVLAGGWWVQPDCNLPCGESFARHGLYSQRYFKSRFGVTALAGYNVDSFGHNGMLPQLLKKSGMDYYVFQRPQEHEKKLPGDLFWWESADGSRVLAFRLSLGYGPWWGDPAKGPLELQKVEESLRLAEAHGCDRMNFYGVGNHGGGPTIANIEIIHARQKEPGGERLVMGSPNSYFARVQRAGPALPVVKDDLQHHASGCYSAHSQIKAANRRAEQRLMAAETLASLAHGLAGHDAATANIQRAWERVLFNQFHDIMGGCSIAPAYQDAAELHGEALAIAAETLNAAAQRISWAVDTMGGAPRKRSKEKDWNTWEQDDSGAPLVVFNPLAWERIIPMQVTRPMKGVRDHEGTPLALQQVRGPQTNGPDKWNSLFCATVPALGYRLFWVHRDKSFDPPASTDWVKADEWSLENPYLRVTLDPSTGCISSLIDKESGRNVCAGPAAVPLVIDVSKSDTWGHGIFGFRDEVGRFCDATLKVIEDGPVRACLRVTSTFGASLLRQDFVLYRHSRELEVRVRLDWQEKHSMLKLSFPVNAAEAVATYEIPYGFIRRPTNGEEEPGQKWVDVSGSSGGLALLNDAKYAFDVFGNDLRMTCANSVIYADHFGQRDDLCEFMDQGVQEFRYALLPHRGSWVDAGVVRRAVELNTEPVQVLETYHSGALAPSYEGIRIGAANIVASVLKRAEDGNAFVLRCYESAGTPVQTEISLAVVGRTWQAHFGTCEIKTFLIPDDRSAVVREVNLLEW